jgi:hypothetical protein
MNYPNTNKTTQHTKEGCCTESKCESGLRNNYFEGKRLTADSFRVEQKYQLDRRHLLNRAIHGWGVVYGYGITTVPPDDPKDKFACRLKIRGGLALDGCGRELIESGRSIKVDDELIILNEDSRILDSAKRHAALSEAGSGACWLLSVHYAEQYTGAVPIQDSCHCEHQEWDHTCETVRYSLRRIPCAECCNSFDCELDCKCATCCEKSSDPIYRASQADPNYPDQPPRPKPNPDHPDVETPHKRGGCRCLCDYLTHLNVDAECGPLCEIEEPCARVRVDLRNGVPLACIHIIPDECERWAFGLEVEDCGPRRLVKRNDLLFDLIRGCDLTRIKDIGWRNWHRREEPIPFEDFSAALGPDDQGEAAYVTKDFWVEFSRPVRENTVRPDCFAMTAMSAEREGGWWQTFRVPIIRVDTANFPTEPNDPPDHVRGARIVVDGSWVEDAVRGRRSLFLGSETRIEFEVRGDFIVDCNGQTVDANAVGLSPSPTGNGTPGDTFLSTFTVAPAREVPNRNVPYRSADPQKGVSS